MTERDLAGERGLMRDLVAELYPLPRSVAGPGLRQSLEIIGERIPLVRHDVPTGTPVFDWEIPPEWTIRDAWIADRGGRRVVDFRTSNLHVVSHSAPVPRQWMSRDALLSHLHTLPDRPGLVPYRTSFYADGWGFCLAHEVLETMTDPEYEVCIDADLAQGSLSYGEFSLPGTCGREFLLSAHVCHPSLANDNLSGVAVAVAVARRIAARTAAPKLGLRVVFAPGTIGTVAWLARNPERVASIAGGLTLVCLGDDRPLTYKRSLHGRTGSDAAAEHVLLARDAAAEIIDYHPWGYDERQYNSPGFRLPVGSLMRGRHGQFPEYHTSADNLGFISADRLADSVDAVAAIYDELSDDETYVTLVAHGEPQLGRRGLYRSVGGLADPESHQLAMLWILALSDGRTSLGAIARRSGLPPSVLRAAASALRAAGLVGTPA